ncbi:MAG: hypothetical protein ABH986_02465, partial [archaeon]
KIKLTATGLKERELIFGLCSITPIEFIERAQSQKQPGEYYATVNWDGNPEKLYFGVAQQAYWDKNPEQNPINKRQSELSNRKIAGLVGYGLGSIGGCMASGKILAGGVGLIDCLINAAIPVGIAAFSDEQSVYDTAKEAYKNSLKSIGIGQEETQKLIVDTGTGSQTDAEVFWQLEKLTALTAGVKETAKILLPSSAEAKQIAAASKELQRIGTTDIEKQITALGSEIESYNSAKSAITRTKVQVIGIDTSYREPTRFIIVKEKKVIKKLTEGTDDAFASTYNKLVNAIKKVNVAGDPVNAKKLVDDTFKANLGTSTDPQFIVDDIVTTGVEGKGSLRERINKFSETIDSKIDPNSKAGKALKQLKNDYVETARKGVSSGEKVVQTEGLTVETIKDAIKAEGAISQKNKFLSFLEQHPKLSRLYAGLAGTGGSLVGGGLGWMLANAIMGDPEKIDMPKAEISATDFEKTFTYEAKIRKSNNEGEFTYSYSKVGSEELKSIPFEKRIDSDSCTGELKSLKLDEKLVELQKQLNEKETQEKVQAATP